MTTTPDFRTHQVRTATAPEVPDIAGTLTGAFFDDPVFTWWIPDADRRLATLRPFFELYTASFLVHDMVFVTDDMAGAVVWGPPANPMGIEDEEEFGWRMEEIVDAVDVGRMYEIVTLLEEHHPQGPPHFYLQWAGVTPDRQNQGIGSALLTPVLRRCDRDGVPAYTDATSPHNRRLYERHGFTCVGEIAPAGGPSLYRMWREPVGR